MAEPCGQTSVACIICSAVFPRFALNIERNFTLRYDLRRRFCARIKFVSCAAYLAALLHLRSAAFQYRMPLHKARKRIFRGVFLRERGKE